VGSSGPRVRTKRNLLMEPPVKDLQENGIS
jgi:hypothetical protein